MIPDVLHLFTVLVIWPNVGIICWLARFIWMVACIYQEAGKHFFCIFGYTYIVSMSLWICVHTFNVIVDLRTYFQCHCGSTYILSMSLWIYVHTFNVIVDLRTYVQCHCGSTYSTYFQCHCGSTSNA